MTHNPLMIIYRFIGQMLSFLVKLIKMGLTFYFRTDQHVIGQVDKIERDYQGAKIIACDIPFTFAHPALVLPLAAASRRYVSLTSLAICSMTLPSPE
jgi:hypothetical protein